MTSIDFIFIVHPRIFSTIDRDGEINGIHYHFVNIGDMEKAVERGEFIEYARVHSNMYGTSIKSVQTVSFGDKLHS